MLVAVRVDHGRDPDLGPGQPAGDLRIVGPLDQLLGQQEGHLHRDPLARMVAAHEEDLGRLPAAALADAQHMDRPALDAAPDLPQLGDVRPGVRQLPQLLLEAGGGMIAGDGLGGREGPQVRRHVLQLLDAVAHAGETVDLGLGRAQDQVIRLDLPDVQPQRQPQEVCQWRRSPGEVTLTISSMALLPLP